jgi:hypothetical protein
MAFRQIINGLETPKGLDSELSNIEVQIGDKANKAAIVSQKSTNYTLQVSDSGNIIEATSSILITIPADAAANLPVGSSIDIVNAGSGIVTLLGANGVSLLSKDSNKKISTQNSAATIYKKSANVWVAIGDLSE